MSDNGWQEVPMTDWSLGLALALRKRIVGKPVGVSFHLCDETTWGLVITPYVLDGPDGERVVDVIDHLALEELPSIFEEPAVAEATPNFWKILGVYAGRVVMVFICREADPNTPSGGRKNADGTITWYTPGPEGPTA